MAAKTHSLGNHTVLGCTQPRMVVSILYPVLVCGSGWLNEWAGGKQNLTLDSLLCVFSFS